jgi:hypothetical protein
MYVDHIFYIFVLVLTRVFGKSLPQPAEIPFVGLVTERSYFGIKYRVGVTARGADVHRSPEEDRGKRGLVRARKASIDPSSFVRLHSAPVKISIDLKAPILQGKFLSSTALSRRWGKMDARDIALHTATRLPIDNIHTLHTPTPMTRPLRNKV